LIETIKQLIKLQEIDSAVIAIEERKNRGPEKIRELEEGLQQHEQELDEFVKHAEDLQQQRREVEQDVEQVRGEIGKRQSKLSLVKNNREYRAILKEIDDLKSMMKAKEEEVLTIMEEYENLEKNIGEKKEFLAQDRVRVEQEKKELEDLMKQADEDLSQYLEQKESLSQDLAQDTLDRYNFIRENRGGLALAGVSKGVCTVCNMNLPPQRFNELLKNDHLMTCPNCHRLIYWADHEELKEDPVQEAESQ